MMNLNPLRAKLKEYKQEILLGFLVLMFLIGLILTMLNGLKEEKLVRIEGNISIDQMRDSIDTYYRTRYLDTLKATKAELEQQRQINEVLTSQLKKQNEKHLNQYDSLSRLLGRRPRY